MILEIASGRNDPGDFTRIRISMPEHDEFVLSEQNGWVKYGSECASLSPELRKMNLVRSDYVPVTQIRRPFIPLSGTFLQVALSKAHPQIGCDYAILYPQCASDKT